MTTFTWVKNEETDLIDSTTVSPNLFGATNSYTRDCCKIRGRDRGASEAMATRFGPWEFEPVRLPRQFEPKIKTIMAISEFRLQRTKKKEEEDSEEEAILDFLVDCIVGEEKYEKLLLELRNEFKATKPPPNPEFREAIRGDSICSICLVNKADMLATACRHLIGCKSCLVEYKNNTCPICRKQTTFEKMFNTLQIKS
jgi:hypothetical protein